MAMLEANMRVVSEAISPRGASGLLWEWVFVQDPYRFPEFLK